VLEVIAAATLEVRSAIVYATLIIVLVFVPLFALPGIEGRLFTPLGLAYIVSILASMVVSVTLTPVMAFYLLPHMKQLDHGECTTPGSGTAPEPPPKWAKLFLGRPGEQLDSPLVARLKAWDRACSTGRSATPVPCWPGRWLTVLLAAASIPFFPRAFLPPFNEGTLTINVLLNPGTSLSESNRVGALAEG
jgi:HME family heavy-metal exporter